MAEKAKGRLIAKIQNPGMSEEEIEKADSSVKSITRVYESMLPDLVSTNLRLQQKALEVIEEKIEGASAAQAATIYGILSDKTTNIMGKTAQSGNTVNMIFAGQDIPNPEALMEKVLARTKGKKDAIEVDSEVEFSEK